MRSRKDMASKKYVIHKTKPYPTPSISNADMVNRKYSSDKIIFRQILFLNHSRRENTLPTK